MQTIHKLLLRNLFYYIEEYKSKRTAPAPSYGSRRVTNSPSALQPNVCATCGWLLHTARGNTDGKFALSCSLPAQSRLTVRSKQCKRPSAVPPAVLGSSNIPPRSNH